MHERRSIMPPDRAPDAVDPDSGVTCKCFFTCHKVVTNKKKKHPAVCAC